MGHRIEHPSGRGVQRILFATLALVAATSAGAGSRAPHEDDAGAVSVPGPAYGRADGSLATGRAESDAVLRSNRGWVRAARQQNSPGKAAPASLGSAVDLRLPPVPRGRTLDAGGTPLRSCTLGGTGIRAPPGS